MAPEDSDPSAADATADHQNPTASLGPASGEPLSRILGLDAATPVPDPLLGAEIGGVRIVRLIAQGGMGRVYEGRQERPSRTVAVKVMRPGLATPSMMKRFEYEAEILARLRHPGIAQIFSAGVHHVDDAPVPFFIMEYIPDARTLTRYAEELKLSTRARLDLFRSVCDAVAHGHQRGVIHRDLKPSNILVDASGHPKVIDFGVAKATDSDLALTTMQTDVGQLVGTLQYMGPEQLVGDPNEIDVRCDVYALGVVLYELLTGRLPYDVRQKAVLEVMRIVREEEPTPISSLNRTLRRDVAVISGKCLEKDRARRYPTAAELAADVARHLAGEPISASPPGFLDGVVRLARRHRAAAAAVTAVFTALVIAVIGIGLFARRAEQARVQADVARRVAETARHDAKQRLYYANVLRLQQLADDRDFGVARELFVETRAMIGSGDVPIELRCLQARLDGAVAVLNVCRDPGSSWGDRLPAVSFAYSPDNSRIATAACDGTLRLWDVKTGHEQAVLFRAAVGASGDVSRLGDVSYSNDGRYIAAAADDGTVRLWAVNSGTCLAVVAGENAWQPETLGGPPSLGPKFALSPDGSRLAVTARGNAVTLWDIATGREAARLIGHGSGVNAIAFSPDGRRIVTASDDHTARVWDTVNGKQQHELRHSGRVTCIAFVGNGAVVATAALDPHHPEKIGDNTACYGWDVDTGEQVTAFRIPSPDEVVRIAVRPGSTKTERTSCDVAMQRQRWGSWASGLFVVGRGDIAESAGPFAFSPDGLMFGFAKTDGRVVLLSRSARKQFVLEGHLGVVTSLAFSPDGCSLATASMDGTVRIWDVETDGLPDILPGRCGDLPVLSADGSRVANVLPGCDAVRIWDTATSRTIAVRHHKDVVAGALSPDVHHVVKESALLRPCNIGLGANSDIENLAIRNLIAGIAAICPSSSDPRFIFSPNRDRLVVLPDSISGQNHSRGPLYLWNTATGENIGSLGSHEYINTAVFSPNGDRVAIGGHAGCEIYDSKTGRKLGSLPCGPANHDGVTCLAFSPNGLHLAGGCYGGDVRVWDVATGRQTALSSGHDPDGVVRQVAFSPDGAHIGSILAESGDRILHVWDSQGGKLRYGLPGSFKAFDFSPDGSRLATLGEMHDVEIWDASSGRRLLKLDGPGNPPPPTEVYADNMYLAFTPDGTRIICPWGDDHVRICGATNAEIAEARRAADVIETRLASTIDDWMRSGPKDAASRLQSAESRLTAEEHRIATNMILSRSVRVPSQNHQTIDESDHVEWPWDDYRGKIEYTVIGGSAEFILRESASDEAVTREPTLSPAFNPDPPQVRRSADAEPETAPATQPSDAVCDRAVEARNAVAAFLASYEAGTVTLDDLLDAINARTEAESKAATKGAERIVAIEGRVTSLRDIEQRTAALHEAQALGGEVQNHHAARRERLRAEIAVMRALAQPQSAEQKARRILDQKRASIEKAMALESLRLAEMELKQREKMRERVPAAISQFELEKIRANVAQARAYVEMCELEVQKAELAGTSQPESPRPAETVHADLRRVELRHADLSTLKRQREASLHGYFTEAHERELEILEAELVVLRLELENAQSKARFAPEAAVPSVPEAGDE